MIICPNCGETLDDGAKFCTNCGGVIHLQGNAQGNIQGNVNVQGGTVSGGSASGAGKMRPASASDSNSSMGGYSAGKPDDFDFVQPTQILPQWQEQQADYGYQGGYTGQGMPGGRPGANQSNEFRPGAAGPYPDGGMQAQGGGFPNNDSPNRPGEFRSGEFRPGEFQSGEFRPGEFQNNAPQFGTHQNNPAYTNYPNADGPGGPPAKKKSILPKVLIGAAAAVLVCVIVFVVLYFTGFFKSDEERFLTSQADLMYNRFVLPVNDTAEIYKDGISTDLTFSMSMKDTGLDEDSVKLIEDTALVLKMDASGKTSLINLLLQMKGTSLLNARLNYDGENISFALPEVNENLYTFNYKDFSKELGIEDPPSLNQEELSKLALSKDLQDKLTERYGKILVNAFNKDNFEVKKETVEFERLGKEGKYTHYIYQPSKNDIQGVIEDIADALKNDEDLKNWASETADALGTMSVADMYGTDISEIQDYLRNGCDELSEELKNNAESIAESMVGNDFIWELALDSKDEVRLIRIGPKDGTQIVYESYKDSDGRISEAIYQSNDDREGYFENEYEIKSGNCVGTFRYVSSYGAWKIEYDFSEKERSTLGVPLGSFRFIEDDSSSEMQIEFKTAKGDGGDDHIFSLAYGSGNPNLEFKINATEKSSAAPPEGSNKIDLSEYDESEYDEVFSELGEDIYSFIENNPDIEELANSIGGF